MVIIYGQPIRKSDLEKYGEKWEEETRMASTFNKNQPRNSANKNKTVVKDA